VIFQAHWLDLLGAVDHRISGTPDLRGVTHDTRELRGGEAFVALKGQRFDGDAFLAAAHAAGALLLISENLEAVKTFPSYVVVRDARRALAILSDLVYGSPTSQLSAVAVTGTNGKTSTTYLLEAAALACGFKPGVMGTVEYRYAGRAVPAGHTTPEAPELQRILRDMADAGCTHVFMEVSSHAIAMDRVQGCRFVAAGASNLTQDHLDFHGTMEDYGNTKARLFTELLPAGGRSQGSALNADDPWAASLATKVPGTVWTFSAAGNPADVRVTWSRLSDRGIEARFQTPKGEVLIQSPLVGAHNLANIAEALTLALLIGLPAADAARGISSLRRIPGRLEAVENTLGINIWVDYAHTPEAVTSVARTARDITTGRLFAVVGAGGDRDRTKRPRMAAAAAAICDETTLTSDNPRTESPDEILDEMAPGIPQGHPCRREVLRRLGLQRTIAAAHAGDSVLICGKGHEYYQEINRVRFHFDDGEVARSICSELASPRDFLFTLDEAAAACQGTVQGNGATILRSVTLDSRAAGPGALFVGVPGTKVDGADFAAAALANGAAAVLLARAPADLPQGWNGLLVDDPAAALGRLAAAHRRRFSLPVVALTGSCGKTTTRGMICHILERHGKVHTNPKNFNNQLGLPLTILALNHEHDFSVLELGTSEPGEIALLSRMAAPDLALVTMAAEAHTMGLGSLQGVLDEKCSIYASLAPQGYALAPSAQPEILARAKAIHGQRVVSFGAADGDWLRLVDSKGGLNPEGTFTFGRHTATVRLQIPGLHNLHNAGAALSVCLALGVSLPSAAAALATFTGVSGRSQRTRLGQLTVIDDSYNANPASMKAAVDLLGSLPGPRLAVIGTMAELGDLSADAHRRLGRNLGAAGVDQLFLLGDLEPTLKGALEAGLNLNQIHVCETHAQCADLLRPWLHTDAVLLLKGSRVAGVEMVLELLKREV
jgi:murE/murF fusion protein